MIYNRYADKLCIQAVYDTFKQTILKNARKLPMLKNETKLMIDELETQIEQVRQKGLDGENGGNQNEEPATATAANRMEDEPARNSDASSSDEEQAKPLKKQLVLKKKPAEVEPPSNR